MLFDLHVHSYFSSCSVLPPEQIICRANELKLDGICITDHNTMEVSRRVKEGINDNGLCVIVGMEYDTAGGDFLLFGDFVDVPPGLSAEALMELVRERGGAAVGCHPFRQSRPLTESVVGNGLCTVVEAVNGRNTDEENRRAAAMCSFYGASPCGGSDAHTFAEIGTVLTRLEMTIRSTADLIIALNRGLCSPVRMPISPTPSRCEELRSAAPR